MTDKQLLALATVIEQFDASRARLDELADALRALEESKELNEAATQDLHTLAETMQSFATEWRSLRETASELLVESRDLLQAARVAIEECNSAATHQSLRNLEKAAANQQAALRALADQQGMLLEHVREEHVALRKAHDELRTKYASCEQLLSRRQKKRLAFSVEPIPSMSTQRTETSTTAPK